MAQTFAGQDRCDAASHDRPFVIEWDATDLASFESRAQSDLVFVRYQGCSLEIVDSCMDASIPGRFGAYAPTTWTSGSVEHLEIADEGALFAKLPLGVARLGARVSGGESFLMEYFVSGTRDATRDAVYRGDLDANRCGEATHFVSAYNLGAFVLRSSTERAVEAGAEVRGVGAGGRRSHTRDAEKMGGSIADCTGDTALEAAACRVPIRLTLRPIDAADNPDLAAAVAPDTDASLNLAGKTAREQKRQKRAATLRLSATAKFNAGDGAGCLDDLDASDKLYGEPSFRSTHPESGALHMRSVCAMMAGKCKTGRKLMQRSTEHLMPKTKPKARDELVEAQALRYCAGERGGTPRDKVRRAVATIDRANVEVVSAKACWSAYQSLKTNLPKADPSGENSDFDRPRIILATGAASCLVEAGDCARAKKAFLAEYRGWNGAPGTAKDFGEMFPACG